MLQLRYDTPRAWCEVARRDVEALLVDHAHLEKKAAGTAVTLLFRYPAEHRLQAPLAELAREELEHFGVVLAELERRGWSLRRQRASAYAGRLHRAVRAGERERLLDTLLVAALIEARSCERFTLLADDFAERDSALAELYRALLASEARHHGIYLRLADEVDSPEVARARLAVLAEREARVARELVEDAQRPGAPVRLHG